MHHHVSYLWREPYCKIAFMYVVECLKIIFNRVVLQSSTAMCSRVEINWVPWRYVWIACLQQCVFEEAVSCEHSCPDIPTLALCFARERKYCFTRQLVFVCVCMCCARLNSRMIRAKHSKVLSCSHLDYFFISFLYILLLLAPLKFFLLGDSSCTWADQLLVGSV